MIEDYYRDFLAAEKAAVELPAETKNKINSINKNTPNTIDVETFGELINDVLLVRDSFRKVYKPDMQKEIVDELLKLDRLVSKIENKLREHCLRFEVNELAQEVSNAIQKLVDRDFGLGSILIRAAKRDHPLQTPVIRGDNGREDNDPERGNI